MQDNVNPYASPAEAGLGDTLMAPMATSAVIAYATARTRALWVTAFLAVVLLGNFVSAWSAWLQIDLLARIGEGDFTAGETVQNDTREALIGLVLFAAAVGSLISLLMWFHRAHRNLPSLGTTALRFTPGWAVGWWFVPVFSLFRPYQVAKEIWRGSDPCTLSSTEQTSRLPTSTAMIRWWWAFFLIMIFMKPSSFCLDRRAESIEDLIAATWLDFGGCFITAIVALLTILVICRVTANQEERFRLLTEQG